MQSAQDRRTARERARGTVRMVAPDMRALIMTDEGSLTIVRQLGGAPFVIGDYVSGLATERGNCQLRNETTRQKIAVLVDALRVAPCALPAALSAGGRGPAGQAFGAGGTPSAVLLDASGRVASPVAVGARGVMALAAPVEIGAAVQRMGSSGERSGVL